MCSVFNEQNCQARLQSLLTEKYNYYTTISIKCLTNALCYIQFSSSCGFLGQQGVPFHCWMVVRYCFSGFRFLQVLPLFLVRYLSSSTKHLSSGTKHLSSGIKHLSSMYQASVKQVPIKHLSSNHQASVKQVPSNDQASVKQVQMLDGCLVLA